MQADGVVRSRKFGALWTHGSVKKPDNRAFCKSCRRDKAGRSANPANNATNSDGKSGSFCPVVVVEPAKD